MVRVKVDEKFEGVVIALMTPMYDDGRVDYERMKSLIDYLLKYRIHGLYPCGSSGEAPKLTLDEKKKLTSIVVDHVDEQVPVFAGAGGTTTDDTVELALYAKDVGADSIILLPPYYYHPTKEALYQHYKMIASRVDLPLFLYNVPNFAGYIHPNELVVDLVKEFSNIVGIKDSSGDMINLIDLISMLEGRASVFQGLEPLILCSLVMGAKGATVSDANVAPQIVVDIFEGFKEGRMKDAVESQFKLAFLDRHMGYEDFIIATKEALKLIGRPIGPTRRPSSKVKDDDLAKMKEALRRLNLLNK